MASADVDGDGSLSIVELQDFTISYGGQGNFSSIDVDGSGLISSNEFYAYASSLAAADSDGDGSVSGPELAQYIAVFGGSGTIATLDTDENGSVSRAEFDAYTGSMASADLDGDESLSASELTRYQGTYGGSGSLATIDSNGDGSISSEEFDAYTGSMASADTNGDGSVSHAEFLRFTSVYAVNTTYTAVDVDGDAIISATEFTDHFVGDCDNALGIGYTCQCLSGFSGPLGGPCVPCSFGKYKAVLGSSPCRDCEPAKYAGVRHSTACSACPAESISPVASSSRDDCVCFSGFAKNTISETCQACPAGKFRLNTSLESACADCQRYTESTPGSAQCDCDRRHRGRGCLIEIRPPGSSQDRPFLLQLQLDVNTTHQAVGEDFEQFLQEQLQDFFSIIPTENLSMSEALLADGRRQQAAGMRRIDVQAVLMRSRERMVLGISDIRTDLDDWLGACCRVGYLRALCGIGHQSLIASTNQTLNVSSQDRCEPCPLGYYKDALDSAACEACQDSKTTRVTGAVDARLCVCPRGYIAEDDPEVNGTFVCAKPGQVTQEQARQVSQAVSLVVGTAIATVVATSVGAAVSSCTVSPPIT